MAGLTRAELAKLGLGRKINPNLLFLRECFFDENIDGAILEGSSRSGKTWSSVDFIIWLCTKVETNCTINIYRETYSSFKTTLFEDFKRRLPMFGIKSPFDDERMEIRSFYIFGNKITFLGADSDAALHGVGSDYTYFNEFLDIPEAVYNQATQRCRVFWWADYNPKAAVHWVYKKVANRSDVGFLVTTFLDNPFISKQEKKKILSYEPTHPDDRDLPFDERRPHPTNIVENTADDYMWNVYGLGLRSSPEGLIFRSVSWVDEFPTQVERVYHGIDFGYENDPTALVRMAIMPAIRKKKRLFIECLHYQSTPSFKELEVVLANKLGKGPICWADPSGEYGGRGYISMAQQNKYKMHSAKTGKGSIMLGISILKCFDLHLVKSEPMELEQGNYKYREIQGIRVDEPIDEYNHIWDASRMSALMDLKQMVLKELKEQQKINGQAA